MNYVYEFLINKIKLCKTDSIVVGVSAGPDSMFLLHLLIELRKKYNYKIIVAHINHKIRIESDEEEIFLKNYCQDSNVVFETIQINSYSKENFHAYARKKRYDFYLDLINKYNANYLMTAHHGDDLIETILMRLTRGSSLSGYSGIFLIKDMKSYKIVRPLLYITKEEIKKYNDINNIPYRIDLSNESDKYTRNRYRKYILPFLKKENKNVQLKFLKFSSMLEETNNYIDKIVDKVYSSVYNNNKLNIDLFNVEDLFIKKLVMEKILKSIYEDLSCIEDKHVNMLINLVENNKTGCSINLPKNIIACVNYGFLSFKKKQTKKDYKIELYDGLVLSNGMKFVKLNNNENGNDTIHLDSSNIKLPLYVRNRQNGDFIELKGTKGTKKISDIFIDCKISKDARDDYPIVVDSRDLIIWIPKLKKSKYDSQNYKKCDIIFKCL